MNDFFENPYIIEVLGSVLTSALFLIIFFIFRPKIRISPNICKSKISDTEHKFLLKFYNKSYLFRVIDVKVQLRLIEVVQAPGGKNLKIKYIDLRAKESLFIDRRKIKKDENGRHAYIITVLEDLHTVWNNPNSQYLELIVSGKNSFTNIQRIIKEPYNDKSTVIKPGKFKSGSDTEIVDVYS